MSNPYCSACHRNRPAADFHDGDIICYRHYIEPDYGKISKEEEARKRREAKARTIERERLKAKISPCQRFCERCHKCRPVSNFPSGADPDVCYLHDKHLARMGKLRALAEIRGEPILKAKKTREELDKALRRRRREKQKELDAMGPKRDTRLVKRGGDRTPRNDF